MPRTFRLLETLGEGAYGVVHLAEVDAGEGFVQRLAVKWLHPQWSHDDEQVRRLRDEARLLALLDHDAIVRVHGLTRIGGRLAILMEPVAGVDLSRLASGQAVPARAAVAIAEGVADALDAAWQATPHGAAQPLRVVHRDIKPSNVMVTARGGVKVMDFGVARATFETREARTRSQQFGTARYMAPERWLDGVADAPSDVFSLGITLLELTTGKPVEQPRLSVDGFAEDIGRVLGGLEHEPGLRALIARMTAYRPADRPTAREVVDACRALVAELPGPELDVWAAGWIASHPPRRMRAGQLSIVEEDDSDGTVELVAAAVAPTATIAMPVPAAPADARAPGRSRLVAQVALVVAITVLMTITFQYVRANAGTTPVPPAAEPAPSPPVTAALVTPPPTAAVVVHPPTTPPEPPPPVVVALPVRAPERPRPLEPPVVAAIDVPAVEAPPPPVAKVTVVFSFDPKYVVEIDPIGRIQPHVGIDFERGTTLTVHVGDKSCTIPVDPGKRLWHIDPKAGNLCST
jgi:hypothetical protein